MLRDANAFSGFAVGDVPRAKEFYGTTLGLEVADAALGVEDAAKGIHRTPEVRPVAWFRDPAGNILSIIEE
jgi:hypothetical protein